MKKWIILTACITLIFTSCEFKYTKKKKIRDIDVVRVHDPHSFARPTEAVVTNLALTLSVDFDKKRIDGTADWDYVATDSAMAIYFDVHNLNIKSVRDEFGSKLPFELTENDPVLGQELKVSIAGHPKRILIRYETTDSADALQWLTPDQTAGKKTPFLYTQSQPIYARTWVPCQDSPGIRFTYEAKVHTPQGYMAVMSAENPTEKSTEASCWYYFKQPNPIPSYLLALAVGDIEFKSTGPRSGVYAEPVTLEAAAWEFEETEQMLKTAEKLYGPYVWRRYDVLVLPPSFPYGVAENPMLNFTTPTIIAGDRSLVSLIAHVMANSWCGNLVTDVTWNDFWLNEGFATYLERRLMEDIHDTSYSDMLAYLGYEDLQATLEDMSINGNMVDAKLKLALDGRDPEEMYTDVPYEKGYLFLRTIERTVGRRKFDAFLKGYFEKYAFESMSTEKFIEELYANLIAKGSDADKKIRVDAWVYQPGLPAGYEVPRSSRFDKVDAIADQYLNGRIRANEIGSSQWTSHEFQQFLRHISKRVTLVQMEELDARYNFTKSGNSEVLSLWLDACVDHEYTKAYPEIEIFLKKVGRRKFLLPLYTALFTNPHMLAWGSKIYKDNRKYYHAISQKTIDRMLEEVTNPVKPKEGEVVK